MINSINLPQNIPIPKNINFLFNTDEPKAFVDMLLSEYTSTPERNEDLFVAFTDEQLANFTSGNGIFLTDAGGQPIAHAHYDILKGSIEAQQKSTRLKVAEQMLDIGSHLLVNADGSLELDEEAVEGLATYLATVNAQITRFER